MAGCGAGGERAYAIQTEVNGRPIGSLGAAAAFSLSKHTRAGVGVVALANPARRPRLEALRDRVLRAAAGAARST